MPDCALNWQIKIELCAGRDQQIARCAVYQSCSLGGPDSTLDLCAPLGRIRKSAFDITLGSIVLIVRAATLLATAGLIRLLLRKCVLVTEKCMPWEALGWVSVLQSDCVVPPSWACPAPTI
jgi:hypothetical protein